MEYCIAVWSGKTSKRQGVKCADFKETYTYLKEDISTQSKKPVQRSSRLEHGY